MDKPFAVFGLILGALVILGIFAYTQLEIYPRFRELGPSREALGNEYLALERWLMRTGRSLRTVPQGTPKLILEAPERTVFVQRSFFTWSGDAGELLFPWIEGGGSLILVLDTPWYKEKKGGFASFLNSLGITWTYGEDQNIPAAYSGDPDFDRETLLHLSGEALPEKNLALTDHGGIIRLVRISRGRGSVTVTGIPYFMQNSRLERHPNAVTAWNLFSTGDAGENPGVLFIRGKETAASFRGKLAERGNFTFLIISIPLVLAIGFWMVLPGFGPVLRDEAEPLYSLRERFFAEGRFLKKYGALDTYLAVYVREIKFRLKAGEDAEPEDLAARILKIQGERDLPGVFPPDLQALTDALQPDKKRGGREFVKNLVILEHVLEYI
ncbi:MAG: hypothetical protein LBT93_03580 [Treponema sp.]|nr:hypothetical protein [Treponema sp.]